LKFSHGELAVSGSSAKSSSCTALSKQVGDVSVNTVGGSNFESVAGDRRTTVGRSSPGDTEITPTGNLPEAHSSRDGGQ
jgi:hypothetical protein